jgi:hypothetical protein
MRAGSDSQRDRHGLIELTAGHQPLHEVGARFDHVRDEAGQRDGADQCCGELPRRCSRYWTLVRSA